jgi:hypothetical protein
VRPWREGRAAGATWGAVELSGDRVRGGDGSTEGMTGVSPPVSLSGRGESGCGAGGLAGPKGQAGWAATAVATACCLLVWAGAQAGCCGLHGWVGLEGRMGSLGV